MSIWHNLLKLDYIPGPSLSPGASIGINIGIALVLLVALCLAVAGTQDSEDNKPKINYYY